MRTIYKHEPRAWADFRSRSAADFDDADAPKDALREALVSEQHGLCCYCQARIEAIAAGRTSQDRSGRPVPIVTATKIEHWSPRSDRARRIEYGNLLAACLGGEGEPPRQQHCDTAKADRTISINPADAARPCSPRFRYLKTGDIKPAHADTAAREDIDVLNLNHPRAAAGRRAIIDAAILRVASQKGAVSSGVLERMAAQLETPDRLGNLMPYCQAAIYWLRRQARKR